MPRLNIKWHLRGGAKKLQNEYSSSAGTALILLLSLSAKTAEMLCIFKGHISETCCVETTRTILPSLYLAKSLFSVKPSFD